MYKVIAISGIDVFTTVTCKRNKVTFEQAEAFIADYKKRYPNSKISSLEIVKTDFDIKAYENKILEKYSTKKSDVPKFCMSSADFKSMQTVQHKYL